MNEQVINQSWLNRKHVSQVVNWVDNTIPQQREYAKAGKLFAHVIKRSKTKFHKLKLER